MTERETLILNRVVTCAAVGGFVFMALIAWLLAFDVASLASLTVDTVNRDILTALLIGGSITKGVVVGAAFGLASLSVFPPQPRTAPADRADDR